MYLSLPIPHLIFDILTSFSFISILIICTFLYNISMCNSLQVDEKSPFGPKRKCPWITINGEDIADSEFVLQDLTQRFNVQLDRHLEAREAAVLEAVKVLADEHLFWYDKLDANLFLC